MKDIILIGASRSGKTTFSMMLKEKYNNYNVFHGDMIKKSFQTFTNIESSNLKNNPAYRKFVKDIFYNHVNFGHNNYILETVDIFPEDLNEKEKNNTIIIAFGCTQNTETQLLDIWNNVDTQWLKNKTRDELKLKASTVIKMSKFFENECRKHNIKYIDTSFNRTDILNDLLIEIDTMIKS